MIAGLVKRTRGNTHTPSKENEMAKKIKKGKKLAKTTTLKKAAAVY